MAIDWLVVAVVAFVALVVASNAARRAGEHADRRAGRRTALQAHRRGPVGVAVDLVDASVAMYVVRDRLGWSTATRSERRADEARAVAMAGAEAIRRQRLGLPSATPPRHLVVSGAAASRARHPVADRKIRAGAAPGPTRRSTLRLEVVAAAAGFVVVVGVVVAIWPRDRGGVLSVTGAPGTSGPIATDAVVVPAASDVTPGAAPAPGSSAPVGTLATAAPTRAPAVATPTPTRTPRRTVRPTTKPAATSRPASTPKATSAPTPTAEATPESTPTPTPDPTPTPTPDPTPAPTAEPAVAPAR